MPAGTWVPAYVGVGSNLDGPEEQVRTALQALGRIAETRLIVCSGCWRNPALGPQPQPDFVNAVAGLLTLLFLIERVWIGDPPKTSIMFRDKPTELE